MYDGWVSKAYNKKIKGDEQNSHLSGLVVDIKKDMADPAKFIKDAYLNGFKYVKEYDDTHSFRYKRNNLMSIATYLSPTKKKISLNADFRKDLLISPVSKDLAILKDEDAVKESIKNLILTDRGERLMQPYLGGNIRAMLFENLTPGTLKLIKDRVITTIETYEPRAQLIDVFVSGDMDTANVSVRITFYIRNAEQPIQLDVILQRNR